MCHDGEGDDGDEGDGDDDSLNEGLNGVSGRLRWGL